MTVWRKKDRSRPGREAGAEKAGVHLRSSHAGWQWGVCDTVNPRKWMGADAARGGQGALKGILEAT